MAPLFFRRTFLHNYTDLTIISDGPPGIGCPVIAALSGVNLALIVTEPSESAKQDLIRVVKLANHFKIPTAVCINKYDLNKSKTYEIKDFCTIEGIEVLGLIPYDEVFNQAILKGKPVVEFSQDETARQVRKIWKGVKALLDC